MTRIWTLLLMALITLPATAQNWSTFLDPSRAIDWTSAGFTIPNYTVNCSTQPTLTAGSGAAATNRTQIQNALNSCDATHNVVNIPAGTWYVTSISFGTQGKQVLRGISPNSTTIIATTGVGCGGGLSSGLCLKDSVGYYNGSGQVQPGGSNACAWTGGFSQGTTALNLTTCGSAPPNGQTIILDQANDAADTSGVYVCDTNIANCGYESSTGGNNNGRNIAGTTYSQQQVAKITAVTPLGGGAYNVTISPAVYFTNVRIGQTPGAWWPGFVQNDGVENMTIDGAAISGGTNISLYDCYNCWVKNVRSLSGGRNHVDLYQSSGDVIRDSYFYGSQGSGSDSYAVEFGESSAALVENNIFQQVTVPTMFGAGTGSVIDYNYAVDVNYTCGGGCPTFGNGAYASHNAGNNMNLFEGNNFYGIWGDDAWGSATQDTYYRNLLAGWQNGKSQSTFPIMQRSYIRDVNIIGNVMGQPGYHNQYQAIATSTVGGTGAANENTSIYSLGWAGTGAVCSSGFVTQCDPLTGTTLMRWGNYDTVTAANKFDSTEASPAANTYVNANFSGAYFTGLAHTLPASLYYNSAPSWWPSYKNWPAVGPDVTTGNVGTCTGTYSGSQAIAPGQCTAGTLSTAWASHATSTPAQDCFLIGMNGPPDGTGAVRPFNASACFYSNVYFVRIGATGTNSGLSWTDAFNSLSAITGIDVNDTVCIAGGSYGSLTTTVAGLSGFPVTYRRATASDPLCGSSTPGWNAAYDSQVVMTGISIGHSYVTINGQVANGIKVNVANTAGTPTGIAYTAATTGGIVQYVEISGPCTSIGCNQNGNSQGIGLGSGTQTSLTIQNNNIHGECALIAGGNAPSVIIQNNRFADSIDNTPGNPNCAAAVYKDGGGASQTFRYNEVTNWQSQGIVACLSGACSTGINIYGNIFHDPFAGSTPRVIEARNSTVVANFYNNTVVNEYNTCATTASSGSLAGSVADNNLYFGNNFANCVGIPTNDYSYSDRTLSETHGQGNGANPFTNLPANNYTLAFNTNAGLNLGAPFNVDYAGNTRTTWSRGAYEFQGLSTVATPTFSPVAGTYPAAQSVAISTATSGAALYYTVDGTTPTPPSATPLPTIFSISTTDNSQPPTPFPPINRCCIGNSWDKIETARGVYSTSAFNSMDGWITSSKAHGSQTMFSGVYTPTWANSAGVLSVAPDDWNTTATCQAPLAGVVRKDCTFAEYYTKIMQHVCHVSTQPATPLVGICDIKYHEIRNEMNVGRYWTDTMPKLARMANDEATIVRLYCGDCVVVGGSASAGGGGSGGAYTSSLLSFYTAWGAETPFQKPDVLSYHAYPARTPTISPAPFPTSLVSDSDPVCTSGNTPNTSCTVTIMNQAPTLKGNTVACNAAISSWACGLPVISTEGGWGVTSVVSDQINGSVSMGSVGSTTATFTAAHNLPSNWTTGTFVQISGTSPTGLASGSMDKSSATAITVTAANKFTYSTTVACNNGATPPVAITCSSTLGNAVQVTSGNADTTNTQFLRGAYISQYMIATEGSGIQNVLWYNWFDTQWASLKGQPYLADFTGTQAWLLNTVLTGTAATATPVSGGNVWTWNCTHNGIACQFVWFDGWLASTTYTMPGGMIYAQYLNGPLLVNASSITISQKPTFLYASATNAYTSPVSVPTTTTVKAIGTKSGLTNSSVASGLFTISAGGTTGDPVFAPVAGTYATTQSVTISSPTTAATICWTNDGTTPTSSVPGTCSNGTTYSGAISVPTTITLKALATKAGLTDSGVVTAAYTITPTVVADPTYSPVAGNYTVAQSVTLSSATSGAVICFTQDGSTPAAASPGSCSAGNPYLSPISVASTQTVKAIATKAGSTNSSVTSALYTITPLVVADPVFSPVPATFTSPQSVTITTTTPSALICYTTDGSSPTAVTPGSCTNGTTYTGAITVSTSQTIKAIGTRSSYTNSNIVPGVYTITQTSANPTFSPVAGTYTSPQSVSILTATGGATLCYTTDGSTPAAASPGTCSHGSTYSGAIAVAVTTTIKALATLSGNINSGVSTALFTINLPTAASPTYSPVAGTYASTQNVTISSTTSGAALCYTIDGSTPTATVAGTCDGLTYSTPLVVSATTTVKAISTKFGFINSGVVSGLFTIGVVADPSLSPPAGTYGTTQSVTITTSTPSATICFTIDGTTPTATAGACTHGTTYSTPVSVAVSETIKALGALSGAADSNVVTAAYVITAAFPVYTPPAGGYASPQTVTITSATPSAVICYTTNGATPTAPTPGTCGVGTTYTIPVYIGGSTTLKSLATKVGLTNSAVMTGTYTINIPPIITEGTWVFKGGIVITVH